MAYNMTGGIGGALSDVGGNIMQMGFKNMSDKKEAERKKQADEATKALEEARVARTKSYLRKGDPNGQSPWVSKDAGYMKGQGTPDQVMVEEFNSQNKPIGTRPAAESETQEYLQNAEALAAERAKLDAAAKRQAMLDNSRLQRDADVSATSQTRNQFYQDKMANPGKYKSNPAAPKAPDFDQMLKNAAIVRDSIQDPQAKATLQSKIQEAALLTNESPDEAAQMLKIALREARLSGTPIGKAAGGTNLANPSNITFE